MTPLYEQARQLLRQTPDRPLPLQRQRYLSRPGPGQDLTEDQRTALLSAALRSFFADPDAGPPQLHTLLCELTLGPDTAAAALEHWPELPPERARAVGRRLLREGTDERPVLVGLELLARTGTVHDLPSIRTVGLFNAFTAQAGAALAALGGTASDLRWLADRCRPRHQLTLVRGLCRNPTPTTRPWLLHHVVSVPRTPGRTIRQVAEAVGLVRLLDDPHSDESTCLDAGRVLLALARWDNFLPQIGRYADAVPAYRALLRRAERWSPTLDRYALLVDIALELTTGHSWKLDWTPGEPARLVDRVLATLAAPGWRNCLTDALADPEPPTHQRAEWARSNLDRLTRRRPPRPGTASLDLWTVRGDPAWSDLLEARVLVDDVPFPCDRYIDQGYSFLIGISDLGPGWAHYGDPDTVCERTADRVHWRAPDGRVTAFDAAEYDAEIARAGADRSWHWPALLVADELQHLLEADRSVLGRWNCELEWVHAENNEPGLIRLRFRLWPRVPEWRCLFLVRTLPVDDRPVAEQAAELVRELSGTDPVESAVSTGGDRALAELRNKPWS
ncbi:MULTISPECIES: hypothetical protein [unclassified Kitasatospora]|uniref:hypothetical protein n=1 Tax=unclassified Kitasatospora TaxID=2633591 RepID=UPI00070EBF60|nr:MULTISPECIES: hypothetical protein [unclassified Kitasatospora]KQV14299.1 hypothetical protein ASC99_32040 [Kitasatospora sp. Root107]KRB72367.1 hypothetical protein ASE03_22865 [Kitasatospora sp. Root187]